MISFELMAKLVRVESSSPDVDIFNMLSTVPGIVRYLMD